MGDEFNAKCLEVFKRLSSDNIKEIKYLLNIPASEAEDIKTYVDLLQYMKTLDLLCKEKIEELTKLMKSIGRHELATRLGEAAQDHYKAKWLLDIFKGLSSDNIKEIKYLRDIPSSEAEDIKSPVDLLNYMKRLGLLCAQKIEELAEMMETIDRHDLATRLTGRNHAVQLQTELNTNEEVMASPPSKEDEEKQDAIRKRNDDIRKKNEAKRKENLAVGIFFERTSLLIGPFWNRFARSSGLDQHVVDAIDRNERTVQERALKLLDEMRQSGYLTWLSMKSVLRGLQKRQIIGTLEQLRADLVLEYGNEMEFFNNEEEDKAKQDAIRIKKEEDKGFQQAERCPDYKLGYDNQREPSAHSSSGSDESLQYGVPATDEKPQNSEMVTTH